MCDSAICSPETAVGGDLMTITEGLDFTINFLKAFFIWFDTLMIAPGVSALGFSVAIVVIGIVVGAIVLRV